MNRERLDNLTAAEAGVVYGIVELGDGEPTGWSVDGVAAGPLVEVLDELPGDEETVETGELQKGRVCRWWRRRSPDQPRAFRRAVAGAFGWLESKGVPAAIRRHRARQLVRGASGGYGRDLSVLSPDALDVRWWFEAGGARVVGLRLVVLGAAVVGGLDRMAVRRRMAAMLRDLPPSVRREVKEGMSALPTLEGAVARRVYEVYGRIADREYRPGEELALLGLFFIVNASVFRQNGALDRLEEALSEPMSRRCRKFRRACIRSEKPELGPAIAETIQPVVAGDSASSDERTEMTASEEETDE